MFIKRRETRNGQIEFGINLTSWVFGFCADFGMYYLHIGPLQVGYVPDRAVGR